MAAAAAGAAVSDQAQAIGDRLGTKQRTMAGLVVCALPDSAGSSTNSQAVVCQYTASLGGVRYIRDHGAGLCH